MFHLFFIAWALSLLSVGLMSKNLGVAHTGRSSGDDCDEDDNADAN
jgi:hypothetical protein